MIGRPNLGMHITTNHYVEYDMHTIDEYVIDFLWFQFEG